MKTFRRIILSIVVLVCGFVAGYCTGQENGKNMASSQWKCKNLRGFRLYNLYLKTPRGLGASSLPCIELWVHNKCVTSKENE